MYAFEFPAPPALDVALSDALKAALAEGINLNKFVHYDPSYRNGREVQCPHTPPSSLDSSNNDKDSEGSPPLENASAVEQPDVGVEEPLAPFAWVFTATKNLTPYDGEGIEAVGTHMSAPRSVQLEGEKGMQMDDKSAAKDDVNDPQSGWSLLTVPPVSCMTAALMPFRAAFACMSGMFETTHPQNNYTIIYPIKVYLGSEFDRREDM